MGVLMADADDNEIRPGDERWPPRATTDLMLRTVLVVLLRAGRRYPTVVSQLRMARHVRAPAAGEAPIFALETRDQCHDRTRQRGHHEYREVIRPAMRFDLWDVMRGAGRHGWVSRTALSRLLEASGWDVELYTLNRLLRELVDLGMLRYRVERRVLEGRKLKKEVHLYRFVPGSRPLPAEVAQAAHVARWMGFLPRSIRLRLGRHRGSYLWLMRPDLPPWIVRTFNVRFGIFSRWLLSDFRVDLERVGPDDELVWVVASSASGPLPDDVSAPDGVSPLIELATAVLAGEVGHFIGNVTQVTQALQRYLADDIREQAATRGVYPTHLARVHHGIRDARTLEAWSDSPTLLEPAGADHYNGGALGVLIAELMFILNHARPNPVGERTLKAEVAKRVVGPLKIPEVIDLALRQMEQEDLVIRTRDARGLLQYRPREPLLTWSFEARGRLRGEVAPPGADRYNGGALGVLIAELLFILSRAWPDPVGERTLKAEVAKRVVGPLKSPEVIDLALRQIEHEDLVIRTWDARGRLQYRPREPLLTWSFEERDKIREELAPHLGMVLGVLYGLAREHPAAHIDSAMCLVRRCDLERIVAVLTATRDRLWKQLTQRYHRMAARGLDASDAKEHAVVAQLSFMPIYADERIFPWLASPRSRSSP